jgi:cytochrome c oxidase cbb3-type subunit 2
MIRPMRDEVERYGHYSLAAESMFDHPFQWGSKRTGPDLARVGGRYSDEWHVDHFTYPQSVVPESVMPKYAFLVETPTDGEHVGEVMATHRIVGVPYTEDMIANARSDLAAQADPDADTEGVIDRYTYKEDDSGAVIQPFPKALAVRNFDGRPGVSEMDALIAYMQVLGTMVDFSTFEADASR